MSIGVSFNGVTLSDVGVVGELLRPLPEFRPSATTISGRDGDVFDGITVGPRECGFTLTALDRSTSGLQAFARSLMYVLAVSEPAALTFTDELDSDGNQLTRYAVPTGAFDFESFVRAGRWPLRFVQHDPYLYGKERSDILPANSYKEVNFGGNAPVYPIATATPSSGTYTINNTARHVTLKGSYGTQLTLDFAAQTIDTDGSCSLQTGSRFFPCRGTMQMRATAQTTLEWAERWL